MSEHELNQYLDWEDKCNEIPSKRDEWECVDLQCSHYDGDDCTLGGCFDPPDTAEDEEYCPCGMPVRLCGGPEQEDENE